MSRDIELLVKEIIMKNIFFLSSSQTLRTNEYQEQEN